MSFIEHFSEVFENNVFMPTSDGLSLLNIYFFHSTLATDQGDAKASTPLLSTLSLLSFPQQTTPTTGGAWMLGEGDSRPVNVFPSRSPHQHLYSKLADFFFFFY